MYGPESTIAPGQVGAVDQLHQGVVLEGAQRGRPERQDLGTMKKKRMMTQEFMKKHDLSPDKSVILEEMGMFCLPLHTDPIPFEARMNKLDQDNSQQVKQSYLIRSLSFANKKAKVKGYNRDAFKKLMSNATSEPIEINKLSSEHNYMDFLSFTKCMMLLGETVASYPYENYDYFVCEMAEKTKMMTLKARALVRRIPYKLANVNINYFEMSKYTQTSEVLKLAFLGETLEASPSASNRLEMSVKALENMVNSGEPLFLDLSKQDKLSIYKQVTFIRKVVQDMAGKVFDTVLLSNPAGNMVERMFSIHCQRYKYWTVLKMEENKNEAMDKNVMSLSSLTQDNNDCRSRRCQAHCYVVCITETGCQNGHATHVPTPTIPK